MIDSAPWHSIKPDSDHMAHPNTRRSGRGNGILELDLLMEVAVYPETLGGV